MTSGVCSWIILGPSCYDFSGLCGSLTCLIKGSVYNPSSRCFLCSWTHSIHTFCVNHACLIEPVSGEEIYMV